MVKGTRPFSSPELPRLSTRTRYPGGYKKAKRLWGRESTRSRTLVLEAWSTMTQQLTTSLRLRIAHTFKRQSLAKRRLQVESTLFSCFRHGLLSTKVYFIAVTCAAIYYLLPPYICLTWSLTASLIAFSGLISNKFTPMPVKHEKKKKKK